MAVAHSANAWIVTLKAGGVIHPGHAVVYSAAETVVEATAATTATGVYVGEADCASGDFVTICVGGPCKVFADGASAIVWGNVLENNSSGHFILGTTDKHMIAGRSLENLASGTGFIEMVFMPNYYAV